MMISTKGRYALRVMTQLAQSTDNRLIPLKEIANDQQEGSLEPVACTGEGEHCERNSFCNTYPVWKELSNLINGFLDSKTIADLMDKTERGKK